jgi:hypothetical protein
MQYNKAMFNGRIGKNLNLILTIIGVSIVNFTYSVPYDTAKNQLYVRINKGNCSNATIKQKTSSKNYILTIDTLSMNSTNQFADTIRVRIYTKSCETPAKTSRDTVEANVIEFDVILVRYQNWYYKVVSTKQNKSSVKIEALSVDNKSCTSPILLNNGNMKIYMKKPKSTYGDFNFNGYLNENGRNMGEVNVQGNFMIHYR